MELQKTGMAGCYEIIPKIIPDKRGRFVKTFHKEMFMDNKLEHAFEEEYYSISKQGVLRGMHFQRPPHEHAKLVYCINGKVMDAVVDLRKDSSTFGEHIIFELSAEKANIIYIPRGFAHGFYTLSEEATLIYKVTSMYSPGHDAGIHWDSFDIKWPEKDPIVSSRDQNFPLFVNIDDIFL